MTLLTRTSRRLVYAAALLLLTIFQPMRDPAQAQDQSTTPAPATQPAPPTQTPPTAQAPATTPVPPAGEQAPQPAPAQSGTTAPASPAPAPTPTNVETPAVVVEGAADTILGKPVVNTSGGDMGRIVDVMVDHAGMVRAAIIDFGGFLGVGTRKIAVDWRALHFPKDGGLDKVVTELSQDQLRVAPAYKPGEPVVIIGRADMAPAPAPAVPPAAPAAPAATTPAAPQTAPSATQPVPAQPQTEKPASEAPAQPAPAPAAPSTSPANNDSSAPKP